MISTSPESFDSSALQDKMESADRYATEINRYVKSLLGTAEMALLFINEDNDDVSKNTLIKKYDDILLEKVDSLKDFNVLGDKEYQAFNKLKPIPLVGQDEAKDELETHQGNTPRVFATVIHVNTDVPTSQTVVDCLHLGKAELITLATKSKGRSLAPGTNTCHFMVYHTVKPISLNRIRSRKRPIRFNTTVLTAICLFSIDGYPPDFQACLQQTCM